MLTILVILACVWATLFAMPTRALADEAGTAVYTGTWGTCPWEIDARGRVTVHGPGEIAPTKTYPATTSYWLSWQNGGGHIKVTSITLEQGVVLPSDCTLLVGDLDKLVSVDLSQCDASKVTNAHTMFAYCPALTSVDLSSFRNAPVESTYRMFANCASLPRIDLSSLNVSKCTNMDEMFSSCTSLASIDVSGWDTSSLRTVESMFAGTALTSLDLSGWNTSSLTDTKYLFESCKALTSVNLSGWDTSRVTRFYGMFHGCSSLDNLDVSGFRLTSATDVSHMFQDCSSLSSLDLSGWDTSALTDELSVYEMFEGCSGLRSITVDDTYQMPSYLAFPEATAANSLWWSVRDKTWYSRDDIAANRSGIADTYLTRGTQAIEAADVTVRLGQTARVGAMTSGDGKLTYTCSDESVATVASDGTITPVSVGTTEVTIAASATQLHEAAQRTIRVIVGKGAQVITAHDRAVGLGRVVPLNVRTSGDGTLSFVSQNPRVATVDSSGHVRGRTPGTAKVVVTASETASYEAASVTIDVVVRACTPCAPRNEERLIASIGLTPEEQRLVDDGAEAHLEVDVLDLEESFVPEDEREALCRMAERRGADARHGTYVDLSLYLTVRGRDARQVADTGGTPLVCEIAVPDALRTGVASGKRRVYYLIRYHEGVGAEIIGSGYGLVLRVSNRYFSNCLFTYADVARDETPAQPRSPEESTAWASPEVKRLAGANRYDTMGAVVSTGFERSDWAIVASGENYPDALAACSLAGAYGAPVILTTPDALSPQAAEQLRSLGVAHAAIVGGERAVGEGTLNAIREIVGDVVRIGGVDRIATSVAVMRAVRSGNSHSDTVVVATGCNFADVLSAGPWLWKTVSPALLVGSDGVLSQEAVDAIKSDVGIKRVVIVGGTRVVSDAVMDQLGEGYTYVRKGGENRYETSARFAEWAVDEGNLSWSNPSIVTGRNFPDALSAAAFAGKQGSVLLLVDSVADSSAMLFEAQKDKVRTVYAMGGIAALPDTLLSEIAAAL